MSDDDEELRAMDEEQNLSGRLAAVTAERDALRAAIAAHRSAMRTNTAAVMTANAATKARHPSSIGLITAAQRTIDLMHDTREALFAMVSE